MANPYIRQFEGSGPMRDGRHLPYVDCCGKFFRLCRCPQQGRKQGKLTIGWGRNIEDIGISAEEAAQLGSPITGPVAGGRHFPYFPCCGRVFRYCVCFGGAHLSIAGRDLEAEGITPAEAESWEDHDIAIVVADLAATYPWWATLDEARKQAVLNLRFNLGPSRFRKWKPTLAFLARGDYAGAARQFRTNRLYFAQVGRRAEWIARVIETGQL